MSLFKNGEQEDKTGPVWDLCQWEGGGYKKRVCEGEYGGNIMYSRIKMQK
jgi:hypothetical protein